MRDGEPALAGVNVIQARKALVKLIGEAAVARAIARLPPADRQRYEEATAVSWVPLRVVTALTTLYAEEAGWTEERVARESARLVTEELMNGLWRVLLRFTSDEAIISRTPVIYGKTYNVGELTSEIIGNRAVVTLTRWPTIPDTQIVGLGGGIETVLRCAGRKDVRMSWRRTPAGATYELSWRA